WEVRDGVSPPARVPLRPWWDPQLMDGEQHDKVHDRPPRSEEPAGVPVSDAFSGFSCSGVWYAGPGDLYKALAGDSSTFLIGRPGHFPEGSEPSLKLFHEKGESFEIPLQPDGSFKIGWMPIGKHSATLLRRNKTGMGPPETRYSIPGGLTIEAGKTRYE